MVKLIIRINVAVFLLWLFSDMQFMIDNFLLSTTAVLSGRFWVVISSVFSHNMGLHLLINMFIFYGFGSVVEETLGSRPFLYFYLVAGIAGSLGHCLSSYFILQDPSLAALGASGAISGVLVVFSLMFPTQLVFIFGLIPVPAIFGLLFIIGLDIWGMVSQSQGNQVPIGFGAHLGGALAGFIYYFVHIRPSRRHERQNDTNLF